MNSKERLSHQAPRVPNWVLIVAMALYTGFAIPVSIVAMSQSLVFGVALAAFLAWQWVRVPGYLLGTAEPAFLPEIAPHVPALAAKSSGNASFDAYRQDLLSRLEREQNEFDGFLTRLRDARDRSEFDRFMEDRAQAARLAEPT